MIVEEITTTESIAADQCHRRSASPPPPGFDDIQPCPHCEVSCRREHFGYEGDYRLGYVITLLYCEHCNIGLEVYWYFRDGRWRNSYGTFTHTGDKATEIRNRVEAVTCVTM